jgi:carbon storage regulator
MLVFTRRIDEGIMIGDDIRIVVVGVNAGKVRLGFAAPSDVTVLRKELFDRPPSTDSPQPLGKTADQRLPRQG